jgi:hypothetical protein
MRRSKVFTLSTSVLFLCLVAMPALRLSAQDKPVSVPSTAAVQPAQQTQNAAAKPPDLSKEAVVYEKYATSVREEADGTGVRKTSVRARVLADAGVKDMAVLEFTYTASNQQMDIDAVRVIRPDGTVVVTPAYNIQDMPADVSREAPMYSDIHEKHVAVKGLGVGDVLEYETTLRTLKPDVPGHFWLEYSFEQNSIVLEETLDLDLPADKQARVASADLQPTVKTAAGRKLYHWASSNLARPDPDAPPKSTKHWKPSVQVTTFSSWEQVGAWYASLQKDALTVTPAIQARADALTKELTTNDAKLHAIFNNVALHIHYIGLEFGIGRYQPHPADDVLSNEYGDCKDKHTLLAALLKAAGIEAWPVLISSSRPLDPDTPSPAQFDHVITLAVLDGKLVWMDSTAEVAPIGVLYASLRDKQALAIPIAKPAYLERTAADLPFPQITTFHAAGVLNDQGTFTGHIEQSTRGDGNTILRAVIRAIPQARWQTFVEGFANRTGFSGEVKNPQISPLEKTEEPITISYDYAREKYGEWDNRRISPPLPPVGIELVPGVKQVKPADEVDLGSPGELTYTAEVKVPDGWLLFPPGPADVVEDWGEYHAKYAFEGGKFTAQRKLVIKKDKVPLADWDKYLAFRQAVYTDEIKAMANNPGDVTNRYLQNFGETGEPEWFEDLAQKIQALRALGTILDSDPPPSKAGAWTASEAARKAATEIETKTLTLPGSDAQSLHAEVALANAWCLRGWLALNQGDLPTAESYLRASWKLGLDKLSGYLIGQLLEAKGEKAAAAHQYELAHFASNNPRLDLSSYADERDKKIAAAYRRVSGKELPTSALRGGSYDGSVMAEFDKEREYPRLIPVTKLTGAGYYTLVFEAGKPVKAAYLGGDAGMERLTPQLESAHWRPALPTGSKARLIREVRMICTPYAGCDAHMIAAGSIETPPINVKHFEKIPNGKGGEQTIQIRLN